jgi:hypothetical protein
MGECFVSLAGGETGKILQRHSNHRGRLSRDPGRERDGCRAVPCALLLTAYACEKTMDLRDTAKQIRHVLSLLLEGAFKIPIILSSIDRYGSVMLAEYTPVPGKKDYWNCEIIRD